MTRTKQRPTLTQQAQARSACKRAVAIIKGKGEKKTQMEAAENLGISRQALNKWKVIPPGRVHSISQMTRIPPHELRPDLPTMFPPKEKRS